MPTFTTIENKDTEPAVREGASSLSGNVEASIRIRPMGAADFEHVLELRSVVGWAADPRAFDLLRGMSDARWAVAENRHESLVGMVGAVPLGSIGILCHLAVHDGYRKMGIGTRLTSWAKAYLRSRGATRLRLYSTPEAEELYRASGFTPVAPRTVYRLENSRIELRECNKEDHCIDTLTAGDLTELYGVDRWSYGADRSALILAILRRHPGRGFIARDAGGRIKGYLIRADTAHATRVGPFMAASPDVARLLLTRALKDRDAAAVEITVPGDGPAHDLLEEFGFTRSEDRLRMEVGESPEPRSAGLEQYSTTPYLAT